MKRPVAGLAIAALLTAAPLFAQEHPMGHPADSAGHEGMMRSGMEHDARRGMMHGMQRMQGHDGMMGMHRNGMMMGMAHGPSMILRLQDALELSDDQVERLEALHETARSGMRQHMMQGMRTMHAAQEMLAGESPDLEAYEAQLRQAANHMVLAHKAMASAGLEARALLTPEQLDRLAIARSMMREMHGGDRMRGMMQRHDMPHSGGEGHDG